MFQKKKTKKNLKNLGVFDGGVHLDMEATNRMQNHAIFIILT